MWKSDEGRGRRKDLEDRRMEDRRMKGGGRVWKRGVWMKGGEGWEEGREKG